MNQQAGVSPSVLLTIAGFDPCGGAGIAADLKTFAAHNSYGVAAITALTVQSTRGVRGVQPVSAELLRAQLEELVKDIPIAGVKIGMLATRANGQGGAELTTGGDREKPLDLLYDGSTFTPFETDRVKSECTHGSGCTFSSAIAANLASGRPLNEKARPPPSATSRSHFRTEPTASTEGTQRTSGAEAPRIWWLCRHGFLRLRSGRGSRALPGAQNRTVLK